ncbi:LysR family transcriptional regulator [Pseudoduganella lutea]|uniref:LysR family transcriptional regulator n=1 Tax=Pseudoduganella lutea TaxID=321985 RepID=A0A4P6L3I7_9BURK|nr:LysR family transcriptional regulator [Pseudoduganella lutea]QBE66049.1 LysR family transcriptional regulator [Pseudoduganella lutea]
MDTELTSYLDAFLAAGEERSFSAAARRLGLTPAAVSKSVARLETRLGVRLFQRSTRSLALTTDGERLYAQVGLPRRDIGDALAALRQGAGEPAGTLKVSLAHAVGRDYVVPLLAPFVRRYPAVVPDLHFDNRQVDLVAEGFDVAIGGGIALTEGVVARELARVRLVLAAAPSYLEANPPPEGPGDLARHQAVVRRSLDSGRLLPWQLYHRDGVQVLATARAVAAMNDPEAMAHAAARGMGIALLPLAHALPLLDSGALVRVLPEWDGGLRTLSVYYTSRKLLPAKVRVFIDFLVDHFRDGGLAARLAGS